MNINAGTISGIVGRTGLLARKQLRIAPDLIKQKTGAVSRPGRNGRNS
jgi:hypothetical protein